MNTRLEQLKALTAQFDANIAQYKSAAYDEANTRTDFIDKLFALLDWDIANSQGFSEAYREVVREDKVSIDGTKKAPDYSFRIGGIVKFFEEAKKPSVNIKEAGEPAFQLRRYGWTKKLPLSILTNFAEFAVYDTRIEPNIKDSAGTARIFYCTYKEYEQHFDFLYNTFSKNAILKGSFDRYVEENKNKKGTLEVDESLLSVIEAWRVELAKNIALRNPAISIYNLNTSVQKIIDRIIFLRIAEDKGIEDENLLLSVAKTKNIYEKLILIFKKADVKYNSGLFFNIDWIDTLAIDDKVLSNIIVNLYYPCPYEFSVLPIEILGSIYERFLGKTIRFRGLPRRAAGKNAGSFGKQPQAAQNSINKIDKDVNFVTHTAVIEEKPEVKKAGGVFYTPQFIVNFIVQNTVGEKIKDKTPEEIAALTICDPACGSGSMLVGAYQELLHYHLDWYTRQENVKAALKKEKIYEAGFKTYKLTIAEKQRILTNNIFGVDIDPQAVEVTKLSLYLKLLENEGKEANERLFKYSDVTLLPSLEENIKCGNSLIGTDFYMHGNLDLDDDVRIKVNCFDWEKEFPAIFKDGGMDAAVKKIGGFAEQTQNIETNKDVGFDIVIGNPPYYNIQSLGAKSPVAEYIQQKYAGIWQDKSDILFYFLIKAMNLSKDSIGYILSNAFLFSDKAKKLRNAIVKDGRLAKIVNFEQFQVFKDASITSGVFIFNKKHDAAQAAVIKEKSCAVEYIVDYINNSANYFNVSFVENDVFALVNNKTAALNKKIDGSHKRLEELFLVGRGMETGKNDVFVFDKVPRQFPKKYIRRRISGENIGAYFSNEKYDYVLYVEETEDFTSLPAAIQDYLKNNKKALAARADKKRRKTAFWWNWTFSLHKEYYKLPKIVCSYRNSANQFFLDEGAENICLSNMTVIFGTNESISLKYILAILNSRLFFWRYASIGKQTGGGIFEYMPNGIGKFPIPQADAEKQNEFILLVDTMLALKQKEKREPNADVKKIISRQIDGVDSAIDAAVYALYGLTEEEIKTVEGE